MVCGFVLGACTLVLIPFSFLCFGLQLYINQKDFVQTENSYKACGANAEQTLYAIRVVKAFNQTSSEYSIYEKHLNNSSKGMSKRAWIYGFG